MIELYEFALSGNCHKVRLMLGLLGLDYTSVIVNGSVSEHKSTKFLAMNPFGQVPILKDGDTVIRDSQAILIYLARQYGGQKWWPNIASDLAHITSWLFTTANELARGPNALRLHFKFGRNINLEEAQQITHKLLGIMEEHLATHDWIAVSTISIADVALYPYIALAHEGRIDLTQHLATLAWMRRIEALPGYVSMSGMQNITLIH